MSEIHPPRYPLLQGLLETNHLTLKTMYTNADVAFLFGVSIRTIQSRVADGTLPSRKLIGRARFLPTDLEDFLAGSMKRREQSSCACTPGRYISGN